jgi:hypothetical protein
MSQIIGYKQLASALDDGRNPAALRAADKRNRLGLSRQWFEGQRAFDLEEVDALRHRIKERTK